MIRLAEVRTFSYSGKVGLPSAVQASARRRPPVSATIGGINPQDPGRAQIRLRACYRSIRRDGSRARAARCSIATPPRANPCESAPRRSDLPPGPFSAPVRPPLRDEPLSKSTAPYIHHTTADQGRQAKIFGYLTTDLPARCSLDLHRPSRGCQYAQRGFNRRGVVCRVRLNAVLGLVLFEQHQLMSVTPC